MISVMKAAPQFSQIHSDWLESEIWVIQGGPSPKSLFRWARSTRSDALGHFIHRFHRLHDPTHVSVKSVQSVDWEFGVRAAQGLRSVKPMEASPWPEKNVALESARQDAERFEVQSPRKEGEGKERKDSR
jgi:hypothetical protein